MPRQRTSRTTDRAAGRDRLDDVERLPAQHGAAPLRRLQDPEQVADRAVGGEGVGELVLHDVRREEERRLFGGDPAGQGGVAAEGGLGVGVPWGARHGRQGKGAAVVRGRRPCGGGGVR
ncbi:hypothetical protein ACQEVS_01665 [Streptomyces sp. CA-181903]|uniref:hypothetical protein n=1 Tax=Streptomyces sp. CA-181903 TaxID=3240055 RepID=UPI003D9158BC